VIFLDPYASILNELHKRGENNVIIHRADAPDIKGCIHFDEHHPGGIWVCCADPELLRGLIRVFVAYRDIRGVGNYIKSAAD
jgi:hypothetical protein